MLSHFLPISSLKISVKPSLGALTKSSRTVAYSTVSYAPVIHAFVPLVVPHSFASSRVRGIGGQRLGRSFRGALPGGTGRGFSRAFCGDTPITFCDADVSAVDKSLLFSFSNSAITRFIAAPAVSYSPPPLHYTVIARQTVW